MNTHCLSKQQINSFKFSQWDSCLKYYIMQGIKRGGETSSGRCEEKSNMAIFFTKSLRYCDDVVELTIDAWTKNIDTMNMWIFNQQLFGFID